MNSLTINIKLGHDKGDCRRHGSYAETAHLKLHSEL